MSQTASESTDTSNKIVAPTFDDLVIPDNYKIVFGLVNKNGKAIRMQLSAYSQQNPYLMLFSLYPGSAPRLTLEIAVKDSLVFNKNKIFDVYCEVQHIDAATKETYIKSGMIDTINRKTLEVVASIVAQYVKTVHPDKEIGVGLNIVECIDSPVFSDPLSLDPELNYADRSFYQVVVRLAMHDGTYRYLYVKDCQDEEHVKYTENAQQGAFVCDFKDAEKMYQKTINHLANTSITKLFPRYKKGTTIDWYGVGIVEDTHTSMVLGLNNSGVASAEFQDRMPKWMTTN